MGKSKKVRLGISVGDVNGIGMEVIIKTFQDNRMLDFCTPIIYGSSKVASYHRNVIHVKDFHFNTIKAPEEAKAKKANIINCWEEEVNIELGKASRQAGEYAIKSLKAAVKDLQDKKTDALVTAPFNKKTIQSDEFDFPGHTEYLTKSSGAGDSLMLMISDKIKVGVVTGHIPVKEISESITKDRILSKIRIMADTLRKDFSISKPKIAVLGLNPHAGDNGLIGNEEKETIIPAIKEAESEKALVLGPYAADGFFADERYSKFDGILAMYHDQGLIPFKSMAFEEGVNYTAGLPFVRTSPDHGTAYDIAGKNEASEASFRNAVYQAVRIYQTRSGFENIAENPLPAGIGKEKINKKRKQH